MQFTTRGLFAFVFACALLTGFVALPSDFQEFLFVLALLLPGVVYLLYLAYASKVSGWSVGVVVIVWTVAVAIVMLLGPGRAWFRF
jgi:hypothetical protein